MSKIKRKGAIMDKVTISTDSTSDFYADEIILLRKILKVSFEEIFEL